MDCWVRAVSFQHSRIWVTFFALGKFFLVGWDVCCQGPLPGSGVHLRFDFLYDSLDLIFGKQGLEPAQERLLAQQK